MKMIKCVSLVLCAVAYSSANDIDTLFSRLKNLYSTSIAADSVKSILDSQRDDGTWDGIVYNQKKRMPIEHVENTRMLSEGYNRYCASVGKSTYAWCEPLEEKITKALSFWFDNKKKFVSSNWWMNEIGLQQELTPIYFLMSDKLSESLKKSIIEYYPKKPSREGTNRTWISENVVARGIWERDDSMIKLGVKNMEETMLVTHEEGLQVDHSFYMHGNLLYSGCYGRSALYSAAQWAAITRGTKFAFSKDVVRDMSSMALDGSRWMMWKGMADVMTSGRDISLKSENKEAKGYAEIIANLKAVDTERRGEYDTWLRDINGEEHQNGCRYFWRGELMVCKSKAYYTSLKMSSSRTIGSELINRENRKGFWLGTGVLSVFRHPDDFKNIYPLWDWSKLPGVTGNGEYEMKERQVGNKADFVGGIDDGNLGVTFMELNHSDVHAKKSWFFMDGNVVALAAGISGSYSKGITTSLDQRLYRGKAFTDKGTVENGRISDVHALWHDGIGYRLLDDQTMNVSVENRKGSWKNIGTSSDDEKATVLTLWLDHGTEPKNANYAYSVTMETNKDAFFRKSKSDYTIVRNDERAQAVFDSKRKILMGGFYEKDSIKLNNISFSFGGPAIFTFRRVGDECLLRLVDPLKENRELFVGLTYTDKSKRLVSENSLVRFMDDDATRNPLRVIRMACPTGF